MKEKIKWIGHGSWKFITNNGTVIYIDPWINGNPTCKLTMEDCMDADLVLITHGHDDHIGCGDGLDIVKKAGATLVTLPDIGLYAAKHGIPADQNGGAVHIGGSIRQKDCIIRAVNALHFSDIWGYEYKDHGEVCLGGGCCGFIIEPDGGKSVYFAGDTGLFGDMKLIGEIYKPYVSVLPCGDKYVMGPREASIAAGFVNSPIMIPGHYDTFPPIKIDHEKFLAFCKENAPNTEVHMINPNDEFEF
ncbi:MAG: metal-dependent hydrolase [Clostridiales bacterium]|nr:metal-dependent hydrolase [Clostridiales bacterium]